jgi:hypothetical protein
VQRNRKQINALKLVYVAVLPISGQSTGQKETHPDEDYRT